MRTLSVFSVEGRDHLVQPEEFDDICTQSPALAVMSDFRHHRPQVIEGHISAWEAAKVMAKEHVNLKLVVDDKDEFVGVVSYEDLAEQAILSRSIAGHLPSELVLVSDLMHPRSHIQAMDFEELQRSIVSDLITALKRHGHTYCLAVDRQAHHIRGIISAREIAKRLHAPLAIHERPSLVEIVSAGHRR